MGRLVHEQFVPIDSMVDSVESTLDTLVEHVQYADFASAIEKAIERTPNWGERARLSDKLRHDRVVWELVSLLAHKVSDLQNECRAFNKAVANVKEQVG